VSANHGAEFGHVKFAEPRDAVAQSVGEHHRPLGRGQVMDGDINRPIPR
jgi:hypothetical protein